MTIQSFCSMRHSSLANVPSHNWSGEKQNSSDPVLGHTPSPTAHFGSKEQLDITLRFAVTYVSHKHYNFMHKTCPYFYINIAVCLEKQHNDEKSVALFSVKLGSVYLNNGNTHMDKIQNWEGNLLWTRIRKPPATPIASVRNTTRYRKNQNFLLTCFSQHKTYEGHSEIIDTPLVFWTLGEIKNSAHSKVKREDWTGGKREKVGQLCPSTETGAAMVDSSCQLNLFNQSINDCFIM